MEIKEGYKQTDVGVIPADWQVSNIDNFNPFITSGSRGWARFYSDTGDPFLRITNMSRNVIQIDLSDLKLVNLPSRENEGKRTQLQIGDILISITADVGIVSYVDRTIPRPTYISQHVALVRFDDNNLNSLFLAYFLASINAQRNFASTTDGGAKAGMSLLGIGKIAILKLPTYQEQTAIATVLSDTDVLINRLETLIEKKRAIKQGAMQQLLTGKTRLAGFSETWKEKKFGDVVKGFSSGSTPSRNRPDFYKGEIKWITSGELNYNVITDTVEKITQEACINANLKFHPKGTFLIAITGLEAEGTRGSCGITGVEATTNQSCMALYPTEELLTDYLFHYYVHYGDALALQYCQGTKQQSYTARLVKVLPILLPSSIKEQRAIAQILSDMDAELAGLEQKLAKYKLVKQGMMQELLTGKTRLV